VAPGRTGQQRGVWLPTVSKHRTPQHQPVAEATRIDCRVVPGAGVAGNRQPGTTLGAGWIPVQRPAHDAMPVTVPARALLAAESDGPADPSSGPRCVVAAIVSERRAGVAACGHAERAAGLADPRGPNRAFLRGRWRRCSWPATQGRW